MNRIRSVGVAGTPGGAGYAAVGLTDSIALHTCEGTGTWSLVRTAVSNVVPLDLAVTVATSPALRLAFAWREATDTNASLHAAVTDAAGALIAGPIDLTGNARGWYEAPRVSTASDGTFTVVAAFVHGGRRELRRFDLTPAGAPAHDDRDGDGISDRFELHVVDASPTDTWTAIDQVLPGQDADGDGASNAQEAAAGTDPASASLRPAGPGIQIFATAPDAAEYGAAPGRAVIERSAAEAASAVDVHIAVAGTATPGADYPALSNPVRLAAGQTVADLWVAPRADGLPEGDETVELRLLPDADYTLGASTSAVIRILDTPIDAWRHGAFTPAQLGDPEIAGDAADPDHDLMPNMVEYALNLDPTLFNARCEMRPAILPAEDGTRFLVVTFTRRLGAEDVFVGADISSDLLDWEDGAAHTAIAAQIDNGDGTETVTLVDTRPASEPAVRFIRLHVRPR